MNITHRQQGGLRGRRHPRDPRRRGAEDGYRVLVVSGDRDTIQLVTAGCHPALPERPRRLRAQALRPRRRRRAVRHRAGAVSGDRGARRGDQRQPASGIDKVGEKTAVKWIQQYGTVDELLEHADEITGRRGREPARPERPRRSATASSTACVTDVDLPVGPGDLARQPIDADRGARDLRPAAVPHPARPGVQDRGRRPKTPAIVAGRRAAGDRRSPAVRTMVDEELAKWLDTAVDEGHRAARAADRRRSTARSTASASRASTETAFVPWAPGRPDYTALEAWLASDAPKLLHESKRQLKVAARHRARARRDRRRHLDVGLAAAARRSKADTLGSLVYYYLGETLPEPDPNQLVPETEAVSPATEAWYVAAARRRPRRPGSTRARSGSPATSRCRSCRCSRAWRRRA